MNFQRFWRSAAAFFGIGLSALATPRPSLPSATVDLQAPAPSQTRGRRKRRTSPMTASQTRWYLSDLEAAIRAADGGDMSALARLYRALRRDGTIHGLLSTRTGGLVRMRRKFSGDVEVAAALEGTSTARSLFDEMFPPSELALLAADGIVLGVGVGEMVPVMQTKVVDGIICEVEIHKVLRRLDPEWLRYRWDEDCWYYASTLGLERITPGDGRWLLHCPGGAQEPWNHGLCPALGRGWIAKDHAYLQRENYAGKLANPARVAVMPQGASQEQKQSFFQKVMAWGVNTVFGLTPGYDVKLLESNGRGYEVFQAIIDTTDRESMIALVGQIVTVTGGTGFANAGIHETVRSDLIEETGDGLAYTLNTQGIPPWANRMFGADKRAQVSYDTTPAKNMKEEAASLSAAAKAIEDLDRALSPHGRAPDVVAIASKFGVPIDGDLDGDARPDLLDLPSNDVTPSSEAPLEDSAIAEYAAEMTANKVARCEHGRMNRCPLCGIERVRKIVMTAKGATFPIVWRPIGSKPAPAATEAAA